MKASKEEKKLNVVDLSREELENTYGGFWWEIKIVNGEIVIIFYPG